MSATPRLTFFCELAAQPLHDLFADPLVVAALQALKASVSLGIVDLSAERAKTVRRLNDAGVPVIAWQLLPREQGYWFNVDNAEQASERYVEFCAWTGLNGLRWAAIGLDIETDIREMEAMVRGGPGLAGRLLRRLTDAARLRKARAVYLDLIEQIRADGYSVDSYQFPIIVDERITGSTVLQRLFGLIDLPVDREVLMLYSSFFRPVGAALVTNYAPYAGSVGLGSTGGGMMLTGNTPPLSWGELERDLRLAWQWSDDIHIFSLEGCVEAGYLTRLVDFDWSVPVAPPANQEMLPVDMARRALQVGLWSAARPWVVLPALAFTAWMVVRRLRR